MSAVEFVIVNRAYPSGEFHGVRFAEEIVAGSVVGVSRTNDRWVAARMAANGYDVTPDPLEKVSVPLAPSELPVDFPARDVLIAHGFTSERSLTGMTEERLRRLRGIGPAKARAIIEAL